MIVLNQCECNYRQLVYVTTYLQFDWTRTISCAQNEKAELPS